ncbi:zinc-ribbon domain-containing protein [Frigidibacter sp. MR17.24]|uniref:zinc-ribbon domain-containing protein n=1 Tax=Frigidibacter sp. MR17.24 TaxID=3127345 RepID=UPI00301300A0
MRLTCPNCAAQYEVDAQMIPDTGRDVQCSNCGQMWFQPPEGVDPASFAAPVADDWAEDDPSPEDRAPEEDAGADTEPDATAEPAYATVHADAPDDWPGHAGRGDRDVVAHEEVNATPSEDAPDDDVSDDGEFDESTSDDHGPDDDAPDDDLPENDDPLAAQLAAIDRAHDAEPEAPAGWSEPASDDEDDKAPVPFEIAARPGISPSEDEGYDEELGGSPMAPVHPAAAVTGPLAARAGAATAQPPRRNLNAAVLSVLREEAEREARARRASASATFERQSELPLDEDDAPTPLLRAVTEEPTAAPRRAAAPAAPKADAPNAEPVRPKPSRTAPESGRELGPEFGPDSGSDPSEDPAETERAVHRRDLLPDIEEINSTLRATSERGDDGASIDAPETLRRQRSGFRLGFGAMLGLAVLILAFYRFAPALADAVPALAPPISGIVAAIDAARIWLDGLLRAII